MSQLFKAAESYIHNNLSVISTDNTKRSLFPWKKYQNKLPTFDELAQMFSHSKCQGLAVICGGVSNGLEVIDVDCKYGINFDEYANEIKKCNPRLYNRLYIVKTKSNGYHIYYRCEVIEGNQKLANRPATQEELHDNPNVKEFVLIETRGEGGYVIAPPTEGYKIIQGQQIPLISVEDRDLLLTIARGFNLIFETQKIPASNESASYGLTPWDDYNQRGDVNEVLTKNGWTYVGQSGERMFYKRPGTMAPTSANFHVSKRVFYCFSTSTQFENKGYSPYAVYTILECNGDFKESTKRLSAAGYGEKKKIIDKKLVTKINKMMDIGVTKDDIVDELMIEMSMTREAAKESIETVEKDNEDRIETFWKVDYNKDEIPKITIEKYKLEQFLSKSGFGLYFHNKNSNAFRLIRETDGFIEETSSEQIKKFIKDYILSLPDKFDRKGTRAGITPSDLLEIIYKGSDNYFNNNFFEFLEKKEPNLLRDEQDKCYFAFKNGIVMIDKKEVKLLTYGELEKSIWKSQVNFDFSITIDQDFDPDLCEYFTFLAKISGDEEERRNYALTLIGYILHSYKDPSKPYAPILAEETDDESKGGGTGKGIFFKAISELIPTVRIDGKNFKPDKSFAFQRVDLGTKLVVIEDCPKNVDFEKYYPTITEGMTIEKKNKDELFLSYAESPKIAFTTNYSIAANAEHAKRRQRVFEFAPFFNSKYTPIDHFGHKLFDNWDEDEWNRFYNLMFFCVSLYLEHGIKEVDNSEKLRRKHIKLSFGEEFLEYIDDKYNNKTDNYYQLTEEWKNFMAKHEIEKKDYSLKRFRKAIELSSAILDMKLEWSENRQNNNCKQFRLR